MTGSIPYAKATSGGAHEFLDHGLPRDRAPGFWPEYVEPTPLARAIQMPLADPNWQTRVLNAYVARKPHPLTKEPDHGQD